mmetsp:Transcript_38387/g.103952  ORF Transcript_38387/g.103952 Transcript_38387/m.103952 type:complete len:207 (+) Transcript_38387:242-862(+)
MGQGSRFPSGHRGHRPEPRLHVRDDVPVRLREEHAHFPSQLYPPRRLHHHRGLPRRRLLHAVLGFLCAVGCRLHWRACGWPHGLRLLDEDGLHGLRALPLCGVVGAHDLWHLCRLLPLPDGAEDLLLLGDPALLLLLDLRHAADRRPGICQPHGGRLRLWRPAAVHRHHPDLPLYPPIAREQELRQEGLSRTDTASKVWRHYHRSP